MGEAIAAQRLTHVNVLAFDAHGFAILAIQPIYQVDGPWQLTHCNQISNTTYPPK
jgi:hypothetical protein